MDIQFLLRLMLIVHVELEQLLWKLNFIKFLISNFSAVVTLVGFDVVGCCISVVACDSEDVPAVEMDSIVVALDDVLVLVDCSSVTVCVDDGGVVVSDFEFIVMGGRKMSYSSTSEWLGGLKSKIYETRMRNKITLYLT